MIERAAHFRRPCRANSEWQTEPDLLGLSLEEATTPLHYRRRLATALQKLLSACRSPIADVDRAIESRTARWGAAQTKLRRRLLPHPGMPARFEVNQIAPRSFAAKNVD